MSTRPRVPLCVSAITAQDSSNSPSFALGEGLMASENSMPRPSSEKGRCRTSWSGDVTDRRHCLISPVLLYGSLVLLFTYALALTVGLVAMRNRLEKVEETLLHISLSQLQVSSNNVEIPTKSRHRVARKLEDRNFLRSRRSISLSRGGCHCSKGLPGKTGPKGDEGPEGPRGPRGSKGEKGVMGDSGVEGITGKTGLSGHNGRKGEPGEKGSNGQKGSSGYPAVAVHATGTESPSMSQPFPVNGTAKSIDFHSSEGQSMIIPPTSGSISFLPNSELHFTDPGIYYVYCQVYISDMVGNTVEVCLQQDSNQVAVGVVAKNTSPRTVSLGRLICVKTSASTISVKIQPQNKASVIVDGNGLRTYLGAFLVHNQTSCG